MWWWEFNMSTIKEIHARGDYRLRDPNADIRLISDKELTGEECEELWESASKENPIVIDRQPGIQVMEWLGKKNAAAAQRTSKAPMIHSVHAFVSPIDGKVIRSGAELRSHEREHNVIQVGNEYVGLVNEKRAEQRQLKSDMRGKVREEEKNGINDFKYL